MELNYCEISKSDVDVVVDLLNQIPEFDADFSVKMILDRIASAESIIIVAKFAGKIVGCKIAYNRYFDGSIYSWLGAVLPPFRNQGVALGLLNKLEEQARLKFFRSIRFKTRNKHVDMLRFALKNGFHVIGFEAKKPETESRIELFKPIEDGKE
ncbi:MAG TPA: GNAT family N-acetyltransferase [Prolixibacteraceae bacterium]|nr:GNAT family N-acetyltransferase [Prolixibacteraceae bacterium]